MSHIPPSDPMTAQRVGTVFIVDDEMMVTSSLKTMLGLETSHRIHTYNNPIEALEAVKSLRPDVVISDFSMPGMDGISFLREVKKLLPESTLILLTGYADKESAIEAINTIGIYRYIEKPWDNEELKISISNGLERAHLVGDLRRTIEELKNAQGQLENTNRQLEALVEARTQDLKVTYDKLQSIVQHTADGIVTLDAELELTSVNPTAERWLMDAADGEVRHLLGQPIGRFLKCADGKEAGTLFAGGKAHAVSEVTIGDHPLEASIAPLPDYGGYVLVLRDITQRKEIERLRDDFVSTLTHDLRTPLLAAIQTLNFFADGTLGELGSRQAELIRMLIQSNREMLGLVNVLLEVYKYESGRQTLILDQVNLAELVGNIARELNALAKEREQELEIVMEQNLPLVRGDKQELKRVFVNLIGNAINYTPKGGHIRVLMTMESGRVQVCVADNGRGIPADDIPQLFQRFSQGTSKQRSSGSGLGLYLSRQIVEAHGGHVWVESVEGEGSRFFVSLPAWKDAV